MAYVGLVPSEYSSGGQQRRGRITKTGNQHARRILTEAACIYRFPARIGETIQSRLVGQPQDIVDIAWKAQLRLCARFRALKARHRQVIKHWPCTSQLARPKHDERNPRDFFVSASAISELRQGQPRDGK
jgi:hypothetical protein